MKKLFMTMLTVGLVVGVAHADFKVFDGAVYDVFITDPVVVGDGSESLLSVVLRVENKTGLPGFDVMSFDGVTPEFGYTGITGKLHQHYSAGLVPSTPTQESAAYTTDSAIDTHFMVVIGDLLIVEAPSEDVTLASAEASDAAFPFDGFADTDFGTFLTGTFAVDAVETLDLANIVVPFGETVTLLFFMNGTGGGEVIDTSFTVPIPEPASLSMLVLGALALLKRRRS
ncbi:hypothetical protein LCGC14_0017870 [marine sediment metagenome]|uniref:PEP-CTERM protein-sorting domain-containing protein n=1 Tax=marine sediment metagenome TaxID=412755 RepID=A0A0F9YGF9_9ZZZZ